MAHRLQQIYNEENDWYLTVNHMSKAVKQAMEDVQNELGGTVMSPANVSKAAVLLGKYAVKFNELQSYCLAVASDLKMMIHELSD